MKRQLQNLGSFNNPLLNFETKENKSTRLAFGETLLELGKDSFDVVVVTADTAKSMEVDLFAKKFPKRAFNVGIAEQNMIMTAAGLATISDVVFAVSYSVFTSMRALEQLRTFICYPGLNVKIIGGLGGFSAGIEGVTHLALEDLGIIRCIPNITIFNPSDYYSTKKAVYTAAEIKGPCYIRLGRDPTPVIFDERYSLSVGKANFLIDTGSDLGIITTGIILYEVLNVVKELIKKKIGIKLIELPTLKPLDKESICNLALKTKNLITIEEHNKIGGLYSAVSEVLCENYPAKVFCISVPDKFTESGLPEELKEFYGLSANRIINKILNVLKK